MRIYSFDEFMNEPELTSRFVLNSLSRLGDMQVSVVENPDIATDAYRITFVE